MNGKSKKVLKTDRPATLRTVRSGISRLSTDTGWHLCHLSRARMSHRAMVTSHHISWLISFTDIDRHSVFSPNLRSYGPAHCWHWLTLLCSDQLERGRWPAWPHSDSHPGSGYRLLAARCHNYSFQNNEKRSHCALIDISEVFAKFKKILV